MSANNLRAVADLVVRRAQEQGHVVAREVRDELSRAGIAQTLWKDVLALVRSSLSYRKGRYYYTAPVSDRVKAEQSQQHSIQGVVAELLRHHQAARDKVERRGQGRVDFIHPVKVIAEDGREYTLLSRDLSATGIRLIGTHRLLGQKIRVLIPLVDATTREFTMRVLWTCPVGDDLVENGGTFLSMS